MNYAIKYFSTSKKLGEADEIIIKYDEISDDLPWFIEKYCKLDGGRPEKRLIIEYYIGQILYSTSEEEREDTMIKEAEKFRELLLHNITELSIKVVGVFEDVKTFVAILKDFEVPFFVEYRPHNIEEVNALINFGVSDIYITNELAFSMTEIAKIAHDNLIKIRVHPNVVQQSELCYIFPDVINSIQQFFIRPEDIEIYENYIDVIEFFGPLNKQDVLLDIYKDGYWMGDLNELIIDFKDSINCMNLMPDFGFYRLGCQHRCNLNKCNYCQISRSLAKELKKKDIYIKKEKKRYEPPVTEDIVYDEPASTI